MKQEEWYVNKNALQSLFLVFHFSFCMLLFYVGLPVPFCWVESSAFYQCSFILAQLAWWMRMEWEPEEGTSCEDAWERLYFREGSRKSLQGFNGSTKWGPRGIWRYAKFVCVWVCRFFVLMSLNELLLKLFSNV